MDGKGPRVFAKTLPALSIDLSWAVLASAYRDVGASPFSCQTCLSSTSLLLLRIMGAGGPFSRLPWEARLCLTLRSSWLPCPVEKRWGLSCSPWNSAWGWRAGSLHWVSPLCLYPLGSAQRISTQLPRSKKLISCALVPLGECHLRTMPASYLQAQGEGR